jgi:hypothetical protein
MALLLAYTLVLVRVLRMLQYSAGDGLPRHCERSEAIPIPLRAAMATAASQHS